ncbi:MAG: hypothetical protein KAJ48_04880 [Elusimicrobiales bacterium]|nr:hypothetical protein [Elusimicrobiales bacterium]
MSEGKNINIPQTEELSVEQTKKLMEQKRSSAEKEGYVFNFINGEGDSKFAQENNDLNSYIKKEDLTEEIRKIGEYRHTKSGFIFDEKKTEDENQKELRIEIEKIWHSLFAKDISDSEGYVEQTVEIHRYFKPGSKWSLSETVDYTFVLTYHDYNEEE